jgi:hypothetical protein
VNRIRGHRLSLFLHSRHWLLAIHRALLVTGYSLFTIHYSLLIMNPCRICTHKKRDQIEAAIIKGTPPGTIARQFAVANDGVRPHQKCIADALEAGRKARQLRTAETIDRELEASLIYAGKLRRACDKWLTDPENPNEYTLDARTGDLNVIYEEEDGEYANGETRYKKKRAKLSNLLAEVTTPGRQIFGYESKTADPRKLILDSIETINKLVDKLARLTGSYQVERTNEHDKRDNREILIEALFIIYIAKGEAKERDDIVMEVDESMRAVNTVWVEARENARRKGLLSA